MSASETAKRIVDTFVADSKTLFANLQKKQLPGTKDLYVVNTIALGNL
jgi:hypothetical protein